MSYTNLYYYLVSKSTFCISFTTSDPFRPFYPRLLCTSLTSSTFTFHSDPSHRLACYDQELEPNRPFLPGAVISSNGPGSAKGILYGTDLQNLGFSQNLKDAIHECLYENPRHRPRLLRLKKRIHTAINAIVAADQLAVPQRRPEGWQNLIRTEPLVP